jgi:isopenicillin N synthase-like dioxygenase
MYPDLPIPIIDLDLLLGEDHSSLNKSVETLSQACTRLGIFYIRSATLTRKDMDEILALSKDFFALPPSFKECASRQADDMARGYMSKCKESDSGTDVEESFDVYRPVTEIEKSKSKTGSLMGENRWPRQPNKLREGLLKISGHLEEIGCLLMSLLVLALRHGMDMDVNPYLHSSELSILEKSTENAFWNARIISRRLEPKKVPQGSHEDSRGSFPNDGCLTFILTGENCGTIQSRTNDEWRPVESVEDLLLVILGDTMRIWTNGLWMSPEVSVVCPEGQDSRLNYSFCYGPDLNST